MFFFRPTSLNKFLIFLKINILSFTVLREAGGRNARHLNLELRHTFRISMKRFLITSEYYF